MQQDCILIKLLLVLLQIKECGHVAYEIESTEALKNSYMVHDFLQRSQDWSLSFTERGHNIWTERIRKLVNM